MIETIRLYASRLLCLLLTAGITLGSFGGVICLGENGHVKIESICSPDCNDSDQTCATDPAGEGADHHDDCVDCSDLPLYEPKWFKRWTATSPTIVAMSALPPVDAIARPHLPDYSMLMNGRKNLPHSLSPPSAVLTTTIILC